MKRKIIWSLLAVVTLITLLSLWFLQNFEQVPGSHWEAAQKEAQRNPFLAFERLSGQLGRPVTRLASPHLLDTLPNGGVLILDSNRRTNINQARATQLLDWVKKGGYLIVAAEHLGDDPLLMKLGASRYRPPPPLQCKPDDPEPATPAVAKTPATIELSLPGKTTAYRIHLPGKGLSSTTPEPAWRAGLAEDRSALLHYSWGQGQITVIDGLHFLNNRQIGNFDHAELIWALLQHYQPQGKIHLASRMDVPSLWQWLLESAWMLLISTAVLIGLWLWQIVPRFGGTQARADSERRQLVQHLAAIGRSVWREGGIAHWLNVVRQSLHKRLTMRHPYLYRQALSEQRSALARIAGCKTKDIQSALTSGLAQSPDDFTLAMQTLQRLDQRL